jgi:cell shape-determining protein MreC
MVLSKKNSVRLRSNKAKSQFHFKLTTLALGTICFILMLFFGKVNTNGLNLSPFFYLTAPFNLPLNLAVSSKKFISEFASFKSKEQALVMQNAILLQKLQQNQATESENNYLKNAHSIEGEAASDLIFAREVFYEAQKYYSVINKGLLHNIEQGDLVFKGSNIFGRVVKSYDSHAFVLLITSDKFKLPVKIKKADGTFCFGILNGGSQLTINYLSSVDGDLANLDIFTSGEGSLSVANLYIGTTTKLYGKDYLGVKMQPKTLNLQSSEHSSNQATQNKLTTNIGGKTYRLTNLVSIVKNNPAFKTPEGPDQAMQQAIETAINTDDQNPQAQQTTPQQQALAPVAPVAPLAPVAPQKQKSQGTKQ